MGQHEPNLESAWPSSSFSCKGVKAEVPGEARGPWEGWRVDPEEETQATALTAWPEGSVSRRIAAVSLEWGWWCGEHGFSSGSATHSCMTLDKLHICTCGLSVKWASPRRVCTRTVS